MKRGPLWTLCLERAAVQTQAFRGGGPCTNLPHGFIYYIDTEYFCLIRTDLPRTARAELHIETSNIEGCHRSHREARVGWPIEVILPSEMQTSAVFGTEADRPSTARCGFCDTEPVIPLHQAIEWIPIGL